VTRKNETELLEKEDIEDELVNRAYKDLARIHFWLGDIRWIVRAIRRDPLPVCRVLDVGCGTGLVLEEVGRRLGVQAMGAELNPHPAIAAPVSICKADARSDPLPFADVAFSMYLGHHLSEDDLIALIRNVGRYSRRFILLDLVRHPLPLALFLSFVTPFLCPIDAEDGRRSIRRSYTPRELQALTAAALAGTGATFHLCVAPFYVRQVVDISYGPVKAAQVNCSRNDLHGMLTDVGGRHL
jgi:SAM-dependent methyltransferase